MEHGGKRSNRRKAPVKQRPKDAREAAVQLLVSVVEKRMPMSDLLEAGDVLAGLSAQDRARAQRLAQTTLRHLTRTDQILVRYLERKPPPPVLMRLRLAVVELCVEREAAHGVVDQTVQAIRRTRGQTKLGGMANAVLRRVTEEGPSLWADLLPPELPKWLRRRLVHAFDADIVRQIEQAHLADVPLDLTLKPSEDPNDWADQLGAEVLPTGSLRLRTHGQLSALPGYSAGHWWVQDAAAAIPARLLDPKPGERLLDLCAAPGGKTLQLAAAGADVVALDRSEARMTRLRENLARTGLDAECVVADALDWTPDTPFDAILLDAPCSATGTIRRHPDLPFVKRGEGLDELFALQTRLIDRAYAMLRPGGRLVYCTCSLLPEEGERQAKTAPVRLGCQIGEIPFEQLGLSPDWRARDGVGLRLRPDLWRERGGMDGFFATILQKPL